MRRRFLTSAAGGFCLVLVACSEPTKTTTKEPEKPAEPETGRYAFQQMYPTARAWATDAIPVQMESINLQQVKSSDGKAGAWEAIFYSPSLAKARMYTWSAVEAEGNLHKGVFASAEPGLRSPKAFEIAALRTDSDAAYKTAVEKSAEFVKKHPDMPVFFVLEMTNRFPNLAWRIVWGTSIASSEYSVFVDATTGEYLTKV
ncbi:MAG TPA: hypothetical protein VKU01_18115 [Bryobacteraceae bacterium]|nr:hypothetical protein [Bryobacteraceae bacterium]